MRQRQADDTVLFGLLSRGNLPAALTPGSTCCVTCAGRVSALKQETRKGWGMPPSESRRTSRHMPIGLPEVK